MQRSLSSSCRPPAPLPRELSLEWPPLRSLPEIYRATIQLCGINASERGEPGYRDATETLRSLASRETVSCIPVGQGTVCDGRSRATNRDRLVAQCFVGDADIGGVTVEKRFTLRWAADVVPDLGPARCPGARAALRCRLAALNSMRPRTRDAVSAFVAQIGSSALSTMPVSTSATVISSKWL